MKKLKLEICNKLCKNFQCFCILDWLKFIGKCPSGYFEKGKLLVIWFYGDFVLSMVGNYVISFQVLVFNSILGIAAKFDV